MFVNFNKVLKSRPVAQTKVPSVLIEEFNKALPEGVRYIATDDGMCSLVSVSEDGTLTIGGFVFALTEDLFQMYIS